MAKKETNTVRPAALRVDSFTVSFVRGQGKAAKRLLAIDDLSLEVHSGEVLAILGPSGSGKSTLLRAIAGLEQLDAGALSWNGGDITALPVHKRGFALMFQDGQLFAHRSVAENIAYALRITKVARANREARVTELLDTVGLAGAGERRVTELSGGEQQRVALARSLAASPKLLLLDEPLSALDRELRERLGAELRTILKDAQTTALFVTHDQHEAATVADRIAVIMAGRIVQLGTPAEVHAHPATPAVARFLGLPEDAA
jgi:thiamine transport system ATP-binding protein